MSKIPGLCIKMSPNAEQTQFLQEQKEKDQLILTDLNSASRVLVTGKTGCIAVNLRVAL